MSIALDPARKLARHFGSKRTGGDPARGAGGLAGTGGDPAARIVSGNDEAEALGCRCKRCRAALIEPVTSSTRPGAARTTRVPCITSGSGQARDGRRIGMTEGERDAERNSSIPQARLSDCLDRSAACGQDRRGL